MELNLETLTCIASYLNPISKIGHVNTTEMFKHI